ncbi:MAG: carboxypeptidase-like regulatory domain-containing protein, partial [Gemmatimonadaceae bacterium]
MAIRNRGSVVARALILTMCLTAVAPVLVAQRQGVITGTVKDESGARVANVEIIVTKTGAVAHTDSLGRFFLARLSPGLFDVTVRRLAYTPMMLSLEVTDGDTTDVDITLTAAA